MDVLIRAFVDRACEDANPAAALTVIRNRCLEAVEAGDVTINSSSFEGGSASGTSRINTQDLLEAVQIALEQVKGTDEALNVFPVRSGQLFVA